MYQRTLVLCTQNPICPEVGEDNEAPELQQIVFKDDFQGTVKMSRSQFSLLVQAAKEGRLDTLTAER